MISAMALLRKELISSSVQNKSEADSNSSREGMRMTSTHEENRTLESYLSNFWQTGKGTWGSRVFLDSPGHLARETRFSLFIDLEGDRRGLFTSNSRVLLVCRWLTWALRHCCFLVSMLVLIIFGVSSLKFLILHRPPGRLVFTAELRRQGRRPSVSEGR